MATQKVATENKALDVSRDTGLGVQDHPELCYHVGAASQVYIDSSGHVNHEARQIPNKCQIKLLVLATRASLLGARSY